MDNDEHIKSIKNDLKTMQMVLREYLDYSEKINISRFSSVNIYELISDVINSSTILTKKSQISCNKKIFYRTDRNCLYRIIFNICENGAKFANNIKIKATKNSKFLRIEIEDDGPGIRDSFKKVFKPFFKVDHSRNLNQGGSGLGLSIANELVKKLNGKIYIKDSKKRRVQYL